MIKKPLILTIILLGILAISALAQGSQATMRVSVKVVSGASVESTVAPSINLQQQISDLGSFTLRGKAYQDALINTSSSIELKNAEGEVLMMKVVDDRQRNNDSVNVNLKGSFENSKVAKGMFKGQLATNIEYF